MELEFAQFKTLYWAARLGSFRAAAVCLNVSQPTVSLRIKNLEQDLGVRLFKRAGRSVTLTEDGAAVLDYAERIIELIEDLGQRACVGSELRGVVRLGVPDSFALLCLADMLNELDANHPKLKLSVIIEASPILFRRLEEGALDVCVLVEPLPTRNLRLQPLGILQQVWIASPGRFSGSEHYGRRKLSELRIFCSPSPSYTHTLLMDWFAEEGVVPSRMSTCNSFAVILELVRSGCGISLVPRPLVVDEITRGTLMVLSASRHLPMGLFS